MRPKCLRGFMLASVLVTLVIVFLLLLVFLRNIEFFINKAKFAEVRMAVNKVKPSVYSCIQSTGSAANCNGGENGVLPDETNLSEYSYVSSVTTSKGVITGTSTSDLNNTTLILTPNVIGNVTTWTVTGTCTTNGYCEAGGGVTAGTGGGAAIAYTTEQQSTIAHCSTGNNGKYCFYTSVSCECSENKNIDACRSAAIKAAGNDTLLGASLAASCVQIP